MRNKIIANYDNKFCIVLTASRSQIRTVSISSTSATTVYSVRPSSNEPARYNVPWNIILLAAFVTFRFVLSSASHCVMSTASTIKSEDKHTNFFPFCKHSNISPAFWFVALRHIPVRYPSMSVTTTEELMQHSQSQEQQQERM